MTLPEIFLVFTIVLGSSGVHLLGGASALVAAVMLKPRLHRYDNGPASLPMGNPTNALVGTFTLWWGWLVFNCGSTFGISNNKWKYAGRAAVTTINASVGGGLVGIIYSHITTGKLMISDIINAILAALVSVTAGSGYYSAVHSVFVGMLGALFVLPVPAILDRYQIDDPVGAVAVHLVGGVLGMVFVGIFAQEDYHLELTNNRKGIINGGGFYLLGVQLLACVVIATWSMLTTFFILKGINYFLPIRMKPEEEILGADFMEHAIKHDCYNYEAMIISIKKEYGKDMTRHMPKEPSRTEFDQYLIKTYLHKIEPGSTALAMQTRPAKSRPTSARVGDHKSEDQSTQTSCLIL